MSLTPECLCQLSPPSPVARVRSHGVGRVFEPVQSSQHIASTLLTSRSTPQQLILPCSDFDHLTELVRATKPGSLLDDPLIWLLRSTSAT